MAIRALDLAGRALIQAKETCRLAAYQDQRKIWTIGWGHTGPEVVEGLVWTQAQADAQFERDIAGAEACVDRHSWDVATSDNQFAAMVSLAFNIGTAAFATTSVLSFHRLGQFAKAADAFLLWDKTHIDGVLTEVAGLLERRQEERALYLSAG